MNSDIAFTLASVLAVLFFLVLLVVCIIVPFMMRSIHHTQRQALAELKSINEALGDSELQEMRKALGVARRTLKASPL